VAGAEFLGLAKREDLRATVGTGREWLSGFATEQLGQVDRRRGQEVDRERVGPAATRVVWFLSDRQTMKRGGSMLHWVAKPTRHPALSPAAMTVTTSIG
jgi:hypothetical protein